jgi:hypothetical protein
MVEAAMIIPTVERWEAGDAPNEVTYNKLMDIIKFLQNPPEGHFSQVAPLQSIPQTTFTAVYWNSVTRDTEADYDAANPMWSVAGGNTKIYIRTRGWYEIEVSTQWAAAADTTRRIHEIRQNGDATECNWSGRNDQRTASTNKNRTVYDMFLDAGTYLEVMVYQESTGAVSLTDGGFIGARTSIRLKWYSV